jgi:hypothetical protein
MTISAIFNEELQTVDAAKAFTYTLNLAWGENEWAVSGFAVTGGSDAACEHGASEALYALGFRHWTPVTTTRPSTVSPSGVTLPRQQFSLTYMRVYQNYGFGGVLEAEFPRWAILNNVADQRRPVGHTWGTLVNWANAQDGFYTNNPSYLKAGESVATFELENPAARAANLAKCVEYLRTTINEFSRASFDPNDGDTQSSELVFGFANDVVNELRATTHPQAQLGLYAYAGHRAPVAFACPYLYVQVALGFNSLGIGYKELVRQWGLVAGEVALRGYGDIAAQDGWLPFTAGICRSDAMAPYTSYKANGADGINMETTGNWCKNLVAQYRAIRFWKTNTSTYQDVLADAVSSVYNNDAKASELFNLWGDPASALSDSLLYQSCQIIDQMQASTYKTSFQRYMTVILRERELSALGTLRDGYYMSKLEQNLRWAWSMANTGEIQSYAYVRQLANANVSNNSRPDLNFEASPHWMRFPTQPTVTEYSELRDKLRETAFRYAELLDTEVVVVDVAPTGAAASALTASDYYTLGTANFVFAGPGIVTVNFTTAYLDDLTLSFGVGLHTFSISDEALTAWTGGTLFLKAFPAVRLDSALSGGARWAYLPKLSKGQVRVSSGSRLTLYDSVGRKDLKEARAPFTAGMADPQTLQAGVLQIDNTNTRGTHEFGNLNPYISPTPYKQLMPKALALREFPGLSFGSAQ